MPEAFPIRARACRQFGSDYTADLLDVLRKDLGSEGPTATLLADYDLPPVPSAVAWTSTPSICFREESLYYWSGWNSEQRQETQAEAAITQLTELDPQLNRSSWERKDFSGCC